MILKTVCIHIPGLTSVNRCAPAYELPLLAARIKAVNPDGEAAPRIVPFPPDLPASSQAKEVDSMEFEMERLRLEFEDEVFNRCYPTVDHFERVFREAISTGHDVFNAALAKRKAQATDEHIIPATSEELVALANLGVDGMTADIANALATAGLADIKALATADVDTVAGIEKIGKRLAKRLVEAAAKAAVINPARVTPEEPSAPARMGMAVAPLGAGSTL
jgi:hypothetical protein